MSIEFLKFYNASTQGQREQFLQDVIQGLSKPQKDFPQKYLWDKEGSNIFVQMNFIKEYYLADCQTTIFKEKGYDILEAIGSQKFNFIDLGAGDAKKAKILLEKGVEKKYDFTYIPVDISEDSNKVLSETVAKISNSINMNIITSNFQEGIEWIVKNKKEKNVFFMIGSTVSYFKREIVNQKFSWFGSLLKKGDMIVLGVDLKKDPVIIQNAYFNNEKEFPFLMNSIKRMNKDLKANFNVDKFYPHSYFDPVEGYVIGCLISKEAQEVNIGDKIIKFKEYEVMRVSVSRKWLQSEVDQLMSLAGMKFKTYFQDDKSYYRDFIYEKE